MRLKRASRAGPLPVNLDDLIEAFTTSSPELRFYLDRETGAVVLVEDRRCR